MQKVLVTGGTGYIGSHTVVELQQAGYEAVVIDNFSNSDKSVLAGIKKITGIKTPFARIDLCDENSLNEFISCNKDIKAVIHFAAFKAVGESVEKPLMYYRNNITGMINLLQALTDHGIDNFVYSSSCTVYGEADSLPVDENSPVKKAESPYAFTKQAGERMLEDLSALKQMNSIILRYFNPIGAHESAFIGELPVGIPNNLIPYITQTAIGIREILTVNGNDYDTPDGTNIRDYINVGDLAKAHVKAIGRLLKGESKNNLEVFNLGTGKGNSVMEVVSAFESVTGEKLNYRIGPRRQGDIVSIYSDTKKANEVLGWASEKTLEDSLSSAWKWQKYLYSKEDENG